ncbi:MAG: hypothetical protein Q8L14_15090 [Myxococcales bacterium]|nr:hypothetical protein [Myxococcales bacterium]
MRLPAVLTWCLAAHAWAGDLHTRDYAATVSGVKRMKAFTFPDALARLSDEKAVAQRGGPACELRLTVNDPFFKDVQLVYASERACEKVKRGAKVMVQYLGLATYAQFVSLQLDGVWYSLPLMRQTAATLPRLRECLDGVDGGAPHCSVSSGPPL